MLPVLPLIPLRPLFFVLGVSPLAWTHPLDDLDTAGAGSGSGIDVGTGSGSTLTTAGAGTRSKTHLRPADRAPWTRARDGWSGVGSEVRWVFSLLDRCIYLSLSITRAS